MFLMKMRTLILYFIGSDGVQAVERNRRDKWKARIKTTRKTCKVFQEIKSFAKERHVPVNSVYAAFGCSFNRRLARLHFRLRVEERFAGSYPQESELFGRFVGLAWEWEASRQKLTSSSDLKVPWSP